jgi:hypothetical protein
MQYDLLLFRVGQYVEAVQPELCSRQGGKYFVLRHNHSLDQISGMMMRSMRAQYPWFFD